MWYRGREAAEGAVRSQRSAGDLGPKGVTEFVTAAIDEIARKDAGPQAASAVA